MALEGHLGFVHQISFDASGRRFFSASIEGSIAVWDVATQDLIARFGVHDGPINAIAVLEDTIVSAGHDGWLRYSTHDGRLLREVAFDAPLHAVAAIDDEVLVGRSDGAITVASAHNERTFDAHDGAVECLIVSGERMISGGRDGRVVCSQRSSGARESVLAGHAAWVARVASLDGRHVVTAGEDGLVIAWDVTRGLEHWRLDLGEPVWGLAVDARARRAFVGPAGAPLIVDLDTRVTQRIDGVDGFAARAIDVRDDGAVVMGDDGGAIHFVEAGERTPAWTVAGRHRGILTAAVRGDSLIAGRQDGAVVWVGADGDSRRVPAHGFMAYAAATIDREQVATGSLDGSIFIWGEEETPTARLEHGGSVFSLSVAPRAGVLLSAGADRWIEWDVAARAKRYAEYDIGTGSHTLADIDAAGSLIVTVGENATLTVWRDRRVAASWPLPHQDSSAVRLLPDQTGALVAFNDGVVGLVTPENGSFVELHRRHDCWVRQLLVSDDGRYVVSCSQNGIGAVYDRRSARVHRLGDQPLAALALGPGEVVTLLTAERARRRAELPV